MKPFFCALIVTLVMLATVSVVHTGEPELFELSAGFIFGFPLYWMAFLINDAIY